MLGQKGCRGYDKHQTTHVQQSHMGTLRVEIMSVEFRAEIRRIEEVFSSARNVPELLAHQGFRLMWRLFGKDGPYFVFSFDQEMVLDSSFPMVRDVGLFIKVRLICAFSVESTQRNSSLINNEVLK